jgi:hypothetical protein
MSGFHDIGPPIETELEGGKSEEDLDSDIDSIPPRLEINRSL